MAGELIFVYADGHLLAISRDEGAALWVVPIDQYANMKKKKGPIAWYGPILVGQKLWLAGNNGHLLQISPADGKIEATHKLGQAFAMAPVVVDGVYYCVFEDGGLAAFA